METWLGLLQYTLLNLFIPYFTHGELIYLFRTLHGRVSQEDHEPDDSYHIL